jgi:hypothetical protein
LSPTMVVTPSWILIFLFSAVFEKCLWCNDEAERLLHADSASFQILFFYDSMNYIFDRESLLSLFSLKKNNFYFLRH